MQWTSIVAIYFLVFVMTAFVMLPFGVRTADEAGIAKVRGQADSAPVNFRPGRLVIRASVIAAALTALFVLNYEMGWITAADLNLFPPPKS
ncbi:DUF1467 family protein [Qipengyuania nanhaisediminis]|uniref:DUF1467 family protein n=1 Tax=Qipengyuania nanhaisediminis TaxID=604088 RepID=UPI0038B3353D